MGTGRRGPAGEGAPGAWFAQLREELLSPDDAAGCLAVGEICQQHHPAAPCTYLRLIGVVPQQQGNARGSQLLRHVPACCDADGTPAYLEAPTTGDRRLYARHGFRTIGHITLPEDGPTVWPMWREPVTP